MRRVVVVQSFWGGPSNQFLLRNLEMLRRNQALAAVAVLYPTLQRNWGGVPVVSLGDPRSVFGTARWLVRAGLMRIGVRPKVLARRPVENLSQLLETTDADVVLCQYATTAARLWETLEESGRDLFIHLHGADTHEKMCPEGHRERVVEMARRAILMANSKDTYDRMVGWGIPTTRLAIKFPGVEVPRRPRTCAEGRYDHSPTGSLGAIQGAGTFHQGFRVGL